MRLNGFSVAESSTREGKYKESREVHEMCNANGLGDARWMFSVIGIGGRRVVANIF